MTTSAPQGIAGLVGRESVGAAVTVGVKDRDRGFPIEKDRFHLVWPIEDPQERRPHHPQFARFNAAPVEARRTLLGQLVHARGEDCFEHSYKAQVAKGIPPHPGRMPACRGNGVRALRWGGSEFCEIPCLGERCEFRIAQPLPSGKPGKADCGPSMRFLFRVVWPDAINADPSKIPLPSMVCKFTSGSWNTVKNFVGFFAGIRAAAATLGYSDPSLAGFRFVLTLSERSNKGRGTKFPVVGITPTDDPIAFFVGQVEQRQAIASRPLVPLLEGSAVRLSDPEEQTGPVLDADFRAHTPGLGPVDVEDQ